jgi:hypothetical protein
MNYLTQYYKNRCDQLQEQISQISYTLRNLSEAAGMATMPNTGGKGANYMSGSAGSADTSNDAVQSFLSKWGQSGYDAPGLSALLSGMLDPQTQGPGQSSNGVGAAAQRIMAGKSPSTSMGASDRVGTYSGSGTSNTNSQQTLDQFLANWGQPGYDGAGLSALLSNMIPTPAGAPSTQSYGVASNQTGNRRRKGM